MANSRPAFTVLFGFVVACQAPTPEPRVAVVQDALNEALENSSEVRVIINLTQAPQGWPEHQRKAAIRRAQATVSQRAGSGLRVLREFQHVPALAATISRDALDNVLRLDDVQYVQLDEMGGAALAQAVPSTGADKVRTVRGLRGKGIRVAVLDSGASTTHPAIADSIVGQHCFTNAGCPPNDSNEGTSAEDDENHGSNVTGIITSNGTGGLSFGYAPDAEIVSVKVLDANGRGWVSDWVSGLDWVYDNLGSLKVRIVNMSLDTDSMYASTSNCDSAQPTLANAAAQLNAAGVALFASSGNAGSTQAMSAPACNSGFVAVGATYDSPLGKQPDAATDYQAFFGLPFPACSDATTSTTTITCFTNTGGKRLDLLAPGAILTSAGNGTSNTNYWGTSQASPSAAGVAALMLECNPALEPADILDALKATGQTVTDARTGNGFPLIRAEAAVNLACSPSNGGSSNAVGTTSTGGSVTGVGSGGYSPAGGTHASTGGQSTSAGAGGSTAGTSGGSGAGNPAGTGGIAASGGTGVGRTTGGFGATGGSSVNSGGHATATSSGADSGSGGAPLAAGGQTSSSSTTTGVNAITGGYSSLTSSAITGGTGGTDTRSTSGVPVATATGTQGESSEMKTSCSCREVGTPNDRTTLSYAAVFVLLAMRLFRRDNARKFSC